MASIFNFKPAGNRVERESAPDMAGTCEIIIFPGVRYERWPETDAQSAQASGNAKKARTKKRKLEMAE